MNFYGELEKGGGNNSLIGFISSLQPSFSLLWQL
jgi:hypothetical protein